MSVMNEAVDTDYTNENGAREYTLVIPMSENGDSMILLKTHKTNGKLFQGKYNGVGGKLKLVNNMPEDAIDCACRELQEETGITVPASAMHYLYTFQNPDSSFVHVFSATVSDEHINMYNTDKDPSQKDGVYTREGWLKSFNYANIVGSMLQSDELAGNGNIAAIIAVAKYLDVSQLVYEYGLRDEKLDNTLSCLRCSTYNDAAECIDWNEVFAFITVFYEQIVGIESISVRTDLFNREDIVSAVRRFSSFMLKEREQ